MKKIVALLVVITLAFSAVSLQAFALDISDVDSNAALLMDATTGKIMFEKNPDQKVAIASITKLMVLLITMEEIKAGNLTLDTIITGTKEAKEIGGSTMFLDDGEQLPLETIIKGICISSANDGTVALAQHIEGSTAGFVARMNSRAKELGLKSTNYKNVVGFDDFEHYSTARDVAVISRELVLNHPEILTYSSIKEEWIREGKTQLLNTNRLIGRYKYATGLKTGTESNAKYCLVATAKKDETELIAVVLGADDNTMRTIEAQMLLEYGYNSFELATVAPVSEPLGQIKVKKGKADFVDVVPEKDVKVVVPKGQSDLIKKEVVFDDEISAPFVKGTKVGEITVRVGDEVAAVVPLVTAAELEKISFFGALLKLIRSMFAF